MTSEQPGPRGIGGWLLLFLLTQAAAVLWILWNTPEMMESLRESSELSRLSPWLRPVLYLETAFYFIHFTMSVIGIGLTLCRSSRAPGFWVMFLVTLLAVYGVMYIVVIAKMGPRLSDSLLWDQFLGTAVSCAIAIWVAWIAYWRLSVRVENTFPRPQPRGPSPLRSLQLPSPAKVALAGVFLALVPLLQPLLRWYTSARIERPCTAETPSYWCVVVDGGRAVLPRSHDDLRLAAEGRRRVSVEYVGSNSRWSAVFAPPQGETLATGRYEDAHPYGRTPRSRMKTSFAYGTECENRFDITELLTDAEDRIVGLGINFEHRCHGPRNVVGRICFNCTGEDPAAAVRRTLPRRAVRPPPPRRKVHAISFDTIATACPNDRSTYWCFHSQEGDLVGRGRHGYFTTDQGTFTVRPHPTGAGILVHYDGEGGWFASFRAPEGETLAPGRYRSVQSFYERGSNQPGLAVHGDGRACPRISGQFELTALIVDPGGEISRFGADFEMVCGDEQAALLGRICYRCATRSDAAVKGE